MKSKNMHENPSVSQNILHEIPSVVPVIASYVWNLSCLSVKKSAAYLYYSTSHESQIATISSIVNLMSQSQYCLMSQSVLRYHLEFIS